MAGSYGSKHPEDSPLMRARIEGLKLLAHHLEEPIVIFNPRMELVFANSAAYQRAHACPFIPSSSNPLNPLEVLSKSSIPLIPCDPCPAVNLFQSTSRDGESLCQSASPADHRPPCPVPRAVPLRGESGTVYFAILMGARGSESVVVQTERATQDYLAQQAFTTITSLPMIGESEPIQHLMEFIRLVAATEATVLIQGESGTGKEMVAKTIHALSRRRTRPFVVVECSSLSETLLESELFGHVRGGFTGAVANRHGLFEEAEGGTIFLDEIGDTTPAFQARLLRVLQEGEIRPVGSNRPVKVDVRVISAGNTPLEDLVANKSFRPDLYYRLAVIPLKVPPLRDRKEDIPLLIDHFLRQSTHKHGRGMIQLSPEVRQAFVQYLWPGNVRELENLIERIVITCSHSPVNLKTVFAEPPTGKTDDTLRTVGNMARQEAERSRILQALQEANGDKSRTARLLHISRSNLYNKLQAYEIS